MRCRSLPNGRADVGGTRALFQPDQLISFRDPNANDARTADHIHEIAVGRPATIIDPRCIGGIRRTDQAWVFIRRGECKGMTALVIYSSIRAA
jgi:hypothetical protein